jgi:thiol-disulfide isomerase/thioredoxin
MKNYFLYCILFFITSFSVNAQTINLEFPYLADQTYDFTLFKGEKRITIKSDTIPRGGKVQLVIPPEHRGYKGIAQWYLTNSTTGGGLDLIINNEDFSVTCLDSIPTAKSIVYKNTQENIFDNANYKEQQKLFKKHDAMLATKRAYDKKTKLYKLANKEYNSLIKQYEVHTKALDQSPLYAAKFRQIVNLTMGIGPKITIDEKEKAKDINNFMVHSLDYEVLYTSNHWGGVINSWVQLQTQVIKDDAKMIADAKTILKRIKDNKMYTDFVVKLTRELTKVGKDDVLRALISTIKDSKKLQNYKGVLTVYQGELTGKAPDLVIKENIGSEKEVNLVDTLLKTAELNSKYSLLLFYQSGCGPCKSTIVDLQNNYSYLVEKGFKIFSISADTDAQVFKNTAAQFPWQDNYFDLEGFNSINFKNYAVIGTPTMYVLDNKGMIQAKIATVEALLDWIKN